MCVCVCVCVGEGGGGGAGRPGALVNLCDTTLVAPRI